MNIEKNRSRNKYTFANINLLGKCNFDCRWCLGKDISDFSNFNCLNTHFSKWIQFDKFIERVKENGIKQIYITGQNTDSLCYPHLEELIDFLKKSDFYVGIRTNGLLAPRNIHVINKCTTCLGDAVSFSVLSRDKAIHKKIVGHENIPDWENIFPQITVPMRVAIVIDRYNVSEFFTLVNWLSKFKNIKYVQVRRISTDTRYDEFKEDIQLYDTLLSDVNSCKRKIKEYETATSYDIDGVECSFWKTIQTTANSMNYYCNGVISDDYFIIEGYLKNKWQIEK
jgi:MoaA/NifB/PqqE/SkfB family radical SAM enzyme